MYNSEEKWFITNINAGELALGKNRISSNINPVYFGSEKKVGVFIDGYVLPRTDYSKELQSSSPEKMINDLFVKDGQKFVEKIKGVFTVVVFTDECIYICNDHHSLKKFFVYQNEGTYIISNSIRPISSRVHLETSTDNLRMFSLFEHNVESNTIFSGVSYSKPATMVKLTDTLTLENYWSAVNLITIEQSRHPIEYYAERWKTIIGGYIDYLKPKDITMTLTGGNDSRLILSALLSLGTKPKTFTFGDELSNDAIISKRISDSAGLIHNNHAIKNPDKEVFKTYVQKIIQSGDSLVNLHRAHREYAIESELRANPDVEMIFGGFMGGDYVKGISYDDYITAKILRYWLGHEGDGSAVVAKVLDENHVLHDDAMVKQITGYVNHLPFMDMSLPQIDREFYYNFNVVGSMHDYQDTRLFNAKVKYAVNPFMDIDFLEMLFSSKYSMLKKNNASDPFYKKILYPEFHVRISHILAPELSKIRYSKKAYYTNEEYIGNKAVYYLKRMYRGVKKVSYPQSFPYGDWMREFVEDELQNTHDALWEVFDKPKIFNDLAVGNFNTMEKSWHKYTNIINLSLNIKEYM